MRDDFQNELVRSGYIHYPLEVDLAKSMESRMLKKEVLKSLKLWDREDMSIWLKEGEGDVTYSQDEKTITISSPVRGEKWPEEYPGGHYANFTQIRAFIEIHRGDWRDYNRITFHIRPKCPGLHSPIVTAYVENDGEKKVPDIYYREGFHEINLTNHQWNQCVWEIPDMPRDAITAFGFSIIGSGKEIGGHDMAFFEIGDVLIEKVKDPSVSKGWAVNDLSYSTSGYWKDSQKTAISGINVNIASETFHLIDDKSGSSVFTGDVRKIVNSRGEFAVLDFSSFTTPGTYKIELDNKSTDSFTINERIMEEAIWKVLNFIFTERCGYPVPGKHHYCHTDVCAEHNGVKLPYCGGWHDAADLSQQTLQTAEVAYALLEMANTVKEDIPLYTRLLEEAEWGLDFSLRMRFGDGYRASSNGIRRWTNGLIGDFDDEFARVHNHSFENFIFAGIEAYAAYCLNERDQDLAYKCLTAAKEDYAFAVEKFAQTGVEPFIAQEHTYNSSLSLYHAAISWAASQIFMADGDVFYAEEAVNWVNKMTSAQSDENDKAPIKGFFYRDEKKDKIVHFNHQSREHLFLQALTSVLETQPEHTEALKWKQSIQLYGNYIKEIKKFTEPFDMIPSGIYRYDEVYDAETFHLLHPRCDYEVEKENYKKQLENGVRLDDLHCLRVFPVWFSFRGNTAVQLSQAKAAALAGKTLCDSELIEIARSQIYWVAGRNPFSQSLMYSEGSNYALLNSPLAGNTVGALPVGVQTLDNEDEPYWPVAICSTYKEIWMSTAGHWLRVMAELY